MRLANRPAVSLVEQRREQLRRRRAAAGTLGESFPRVRQLRIELTFVDPAGPTPTRQLHEVYPPAPALFEVPCPHGGCDGRFDLTDAALKSMAESSAFAAGSRQCSGTRASRGLTRQPCSLRLSYRIVVHFEPES